MKRSMRWAVCLCAVMVMAGATPVVAVNIETVAVGNPGNADDTHRDGYGGVDYTYSIGKFEVTAGQYTAFLNAVAADDIYGLYNAGMDVDSGLPNSEFGCNIKRTGTSGSYSYSVAPDWADRPVNYVSWGDAARFCNWLENGQPVGAQGLTTTEDGSYYLNGATSDAALLAVTRDLDATWVIPSEDEWYKAAYHKNDGVTGNYFDYPTSSDSIPSNDLIAPDPGNNATFYDGGRTIGSPYYRTEVGAHENSESPYGTFDQGGNIYEWTEAVLGGRRTVRGAHFSDDYYRMRADESRVGVAPANEAISVGLRVVAIPEPGTLALLSLGGLALIRRRRRIAPGVGVAALLMLVLVAAPVASADTFGSGANEFDIDFVTISGDAGDLGSWSAGSGYTFTGVNRDDYRMGVYEITNDQWDKFKAELGVPVTGDPSNAYDGDPYWTGTNVPTNEVSWYEAAQFVNWLNTSSGYQAAYKFTGTQGTSGYALDTWDATEADNGTNLYRHKDAFYYLPTEDEWVKAGYWNGTSLQTYATKPGETLHQGDGVSGTGWNYYDDGYATDPYGPWDVGSGSEELNGTFDIMGNVWEWMESPYTLGDYGTGSLRGLRGGSYNGSDGGLASSYRVDYSPVGENVGIGFRVASEVPEPCTVGLLALGGLALIRRRRFCC